MRYDEFKNRLDYLVKRDGNMPTSDVLQAIINDKASYILNTHLIFSHIEIDKRGFTPLYFIDEYYFVRKFEIPTSDESVIDFDDFNLLNALLNLCAFEISISEKESFKIAANKSLMNYEMAINDPMLDTLEKALYHRGYAKPYRPNFAINPYYEWDEIFLNSLDTWMSDTAKYRGLSYEKFIDLFVKYQNGDEIALAREDLRDLATRIMPNRKNLKTVLENVKGMYNA
ncbi:hypothetical protein CIG2463D_1367 [Campylobacter iguaniorum]|uniref:hypothetical protein n=1 Tax=Campylobacter iguaniorum TaxID=1244531 RepID=UPI00073A2F91|nr:hypothetical protein [Campylobacter iguaniorum]ALV24935.1 hypothetical protein CIG2463D_1367 [Campylobacter iguaniorum]